MATMKDVAAMAGVSFTTVSHVVNRTRPVSDAVRKKVEDAIAQLHYVPSAVARSLKVRTTSIIGLLVPNSTNRISPSCRAASRIAASATVTA